MAEQETTPKQNKRGDLYAAEYLGSGTFRIVKPKRKSAKLNRLRVKNPRRGARK